MAKSQSQKREDEILLRMLKTPPKRHAGLKKKNKANPHAAPDAKPAGIGG